jgi:hypothetical protein
MNKGNGEGQKGGDKFVFLLIVGDKSEDKILIVRDLRTPLI